NKGAPASGTDYQPFETVLSVNSTLILRTTGGRATNAALPYFNIAWPTPEQGALLAIGWPGQWQAEFQRDHDLGLTISGGQETTKFTLRPGEEVRSPLVAFLQYEGDWLSGQNLWRRWMIDHNLPRPEGKLPGTQLLACSSHQYSEMLEASEENQKLFIDRYLEEGFPLAYWWMDAGWYRNDGTWQNTGTWEVDRQQFPSGLRTITDHARSKGVKSIVWFEPERVTTRSWLYDERPQWLLRAPPNPGGLHYDNAWRLLNLGNPEALRWLIEHIDGLIKSEGIDLYRQDFNIAPLEFWLANDRPDRQGITEIRYNEGYLAFWDALLQRNPGIRIDSCASGGRRNDLETLRRSVPLLRSDKLFEPRSQQNHTYGMSMWMPYYGTGTHIGKSLIGQAGSNVVDVYEFRSQMGPSVTACWDLRDESLDYDTLRTLSAQLKRASPNYLGDYYPLSAYLRDDQTNGWMAWQWWRPEVGKGVVHAFRREAAQDSRQSYRLHGLDPTATYTIDNADHDASYRKTGKELMEDGLQIELKDPRSAALVFYAQSPQ
ncbi:MAG: alpha-galactosidase, partial [Planctomycetota bacterium]